MGYSRAQSAADLIVSSFPRVCVYLAVATTLLLASAPVAAQSPGVTVSHTTLDFPEGQTRTYTVVLNTQPTASVTIKVTASDTPSKCEAAHGPSCTRKRVATVDKTSLTFTRSDWSVAQTVTVTAVDEDMAGVFKFATISHQASGGGYDSVSVPEVNVRVADDDIRGVRHYNAKRDGSLGSSTGNVAFWEHQGRVLPKTMRFYVSLLSQPTATTTVML